jgi:hypothetical protein
MDDQTLYCSAKYYLRKKLLTIKSGIFLYLTFAQEASVIHFLDCRVSGEQRLLCRLTSYSHGLSLLLQHPMPGVR